MKTKEAFEILRDTPIDIRSAREDDIHRLYATAQNIALDALQRQMWIPCSERLPDNESIMYWTTHEDGSVVMHGYTKKNGFIYNWEVDDLEKRKRQGDVIAWMPLPLPEPYKEGDQE